MAGKHYQNEIGTEILVDCGCSVIGAASPKLKIKKIDGTEEEWDAAVEDTNFLMHVTEIDDFDQLGDYDLQSSVNIGGKVWLGETARFTIYDEYA